MEKKRWFSHYPEVIPQEIKPDRYKSITDFFTSCVRKYSGLPAFESFGKIITYDETDSLSRNFASYLQSKGLRKGEV